MQASDQVMATPSESPFNADVTLEHGVICNQEQTPDGIVPIYNLMPTTSRLHLVPPTDVHSYPLDLRVFEIIKHAELKEFDNIDLHLDLLQRVRYYAGLYCYFRPNFLVRMDFRYPIGENKQIKVFAVPPNIESIQESDFINYPGVTFWTSANDTMYFRLNYSLANYQISDYQKPVNRIFWKVISSIGLSTNPTPLKVTISLCCSELYPTVKRYVNPFSSGGGGGGGSENDEIGRDIARTLAIQVSPTTEYGADGLPRKSWLVNLLTFGIGLVADLFFPGSSKGIKAAVDVLITVVKDLTGRKPNLRAEPLDLISIDCPTGTPIHYQFDEDGYVQLSADGVDYYYPLTENVNGDLIPIHQDDSGRHPLVGECYNASQDKYSSSFCPVVWKRSGDLTGLGDLYWNNGTKLNTKPAAKGHFIQCGGIQKQSGGNSEPVEILSDVNSVMNFSSLSKFFEICWDGSRSCTSFYLKNFTRGKLATVVFGVYNQVNNPWDVIYARNETQVFAELNNFGIIQYRTPEDKLVTTLGVIDNGLVSFRNGSSEAKEFTSSTVGNIILLSRIAFSDRSKSISLVPISWETNQIITSDTGGYFFNGKNQVLLTMLASVSADMDYYPSITSMNNIYVKEPTRVELDYLTPNDHSSSVKYYKRHKFFKLNGDRSDIKFQSPDQDLGKASSAPVPSEAPATIHKPANLDNPRPLGYNTVRVDADRDIFVPFFTTTIKEGDQITSIINPIAWNSSDSKTPSQAQVEAMRHAYVGPSDLQSKSPFCIYKVTSVANAFANARVIVAQVPPVYTLEQVTALSSQELSQFNRKEHVFHGPETTIEVEWMRPDPVMSAYSPEDINGYLVIKVLEIACNTENADEPKITLWVRPGNTIRYSIPVAPRAYISPSDSINFKLMYNPAINRIFKLVKNLNLRDPSDRNILSSLTESVEEILRKEEIQFTPIRSIKKIKF